MNVGFPLREQSMGEKVSLSNFNALVRTVNALRNMIFDPTDFRVTANGEAPPHIALNKKAEDDWEWSDTVLPSNKVRVSGGQIKYGNTLLPAIGGPAPLTAEPFLFDVDFTGVSAGDSRFLYVEFVKTLGTLEVKLSATRPVDEPSSSTYRIALSKWTMLATGPYKTKLLHRGAIQLSGVFTP